MIAVDEALRRLEISAPERNAILEAFRYADARNAVAMTTAVAAAQQEAAEAAEAAEGHQQASQPALTSKPFTRCATPACKQPMGVYGGLLQGLAKRECCPNCFCEAAFVGRSGHVMRQHQRCLDGVTCPQRCC